MVFLEDFLEMLEELPLELKERCAELRMLDSQVQNGVERHRKSVSEFFARAPKMSVEEQRKEYERLYQEFARLKEKTAQKVEISERMQELVEKYVMHLDKEKLHFKMELESDNPGITTQIEKRFTSYVESVIAMRKESRKRKAGGANTIAPLKLANEDGGFSAEILLDDELLNGTWEKPKGRRGSVVSDIAESPAPTRKRPPKNVAPITTFPTQAVSPAASEKSWAPFAVAGGTASHDSSPAPPTTPATSAAMPNFSGPESRHGRPRKLTSRVQEMFKETLQRQRSYHAPVEEPEEDEGSGSSDDDDDDEAKKTWCTCKQRSYGAMVACDNDKCPYEWFHYHCVGITAPPRGKWYCPHCSEQMLTPSHGLDLNF